MAREKVSAKNNDDWRHLTRVGALVVAVLATLAFGSAHRVDAVSESGATLILAEEASDPSLPGPETTGILPPDTTDQLAEVRPEADQVPPPAPLEEPHANRPAIPAPSPRRAPATVTMNHRIGESEALVEDGTGWTLQFMLTCDSTKADRLLSDLGGDPRLHLFPTVHNGNPCLRICWNRYDTRQQAITDRDLPANLLQLAKPIPRELADLAP